MERIPDDIQQEFDREFERMEVEIEREEDGAYQEQSDYRALRMEM